MYLRLAFYGHLCKRAGHCIFVLWFLSSFFLLSCFCSSPNHSSCRQDVYNTSTHGVALVQIYNAGLKCAARGSLEMQDAKNRHLSTIAQLCRAMSLPLWHVLTIGKNLLNSNIFPTCSTYGELRPTIGWDLLASLGHRSRFQPVSRLGSVTAQHSSSGRASAKLCGVEQRRHLYLAEWPSRWALAHILVISTMLILKAVKWRFWVLCSTVQYTNKYIQTRHQHPVGFCSALHMTLLVQIVGF